MRFCFNSNAACAQDELHSAQPDLSAQERYEATPTKVRRLFSHLMLLEWTFPYYAAALDSPFGQAIWSYLSGNPASRTKKGLATYFQVGKSAISTKIQLYKAVLAVPTPGQAYATGDDDSIWGPAASAILHRVPPEIPFSQQQQQQKPTQEVPFSGLHPSSPFC